LEVVQTDAGCFINSLTPNGNLSFRFEFHGKEISTVAFVNNTGGYAVEYYLPVEVWEYEDANGNGYFDSSYADWVPGEANETAFAYYKNFWFSGITNITTRRDNMGNVVCEWTVKGGCRAPFSHLWLGEGFPSPYLEGEILVPIKYSFHYFPFNGSLKTDFSIENFTASSAKSRLFIEFSMQYTSMREEKVKVTMNAETVDANLIDGPRKINSTTILLVVNDSVKGFFVKRHLKEDMRNLAPRRILFNIQVEVFLVISFAQAFQFYPVFQGKLRQPCLQKGLFQLFRGLFLTFFPVHLGFLLTRNPRQL